MGQYRYHVFVCTSGTECPKQGSEDVHRALKKGVAAAGLKGTVRVNHAGCMNQCGHGPMVVVYPENVWYAGVKDTDLTEIFESHIKNGTPVKRLVYEPGVKGANKTPDAH